MENKIITIKSVEQSNGRIKIKDENDITYSFFVKLQSGEYSKAYTHCKQFGQDLSDMVGRIVNITVAEKDGGEVNGTPIVYRNIVGIFPAVEEQRIKSGMFTPKPVQNYPTRQISGNNAMPSAPSPKSSTHTQILPQDKRGDDIRANVVLKMISELGSAGKIELNDWESWANKWYNYKPIIKKTPAEDPYFNAPVITEDEITGIPF